jgi:hypothetical protein
MSLRLENPSGQAIRSFGDWLPLAHPPDAAVEWKDFHSAKELARAYFRTGFPSVPEDLTEFVHSVPRWRDERLSCGTLLPPTNARGEVGVASGIPFSLGRIRTLLPLDSGGRRRPAAGIQAGRQYLDG